MTAPQPFSAPKGGGDRLQMEALNGHLLILVPKERVVAHYAGKPIQNSNPPAMTAPTDAIVVDVVDLDARGGPETSLNVYWGAKVVVEGLSRQLGETVLARPTKGRADNGRSAPWLLDDATTDPAAVARASAWLASNQDWRSRPSTAEQQQAAQAQQFAPQSPWPAGAVPAQQYPPAGQYQPQLPASPPGVDPAAYAAFLASQQPAVPAAPPVDPAFAAWQAAQQAQQQAPAAAAFVPGQVNMADPAVQALLAQMAAQQAGQAR
jgi:hypothetical protein